MRAHVHVFSRFALAVFAAACSDRNIMAPAARAPVPARSATGVEHAVVTPGAGAAWSLVSSGTAQAARAATGAGAARRPVGALEDAGGVRLLVGASPVDAALVRTEAFAGTALANVTALGFDTYVAQRGSSSATPFLTLAIDLDGDGYVDDQLQFRPTPAVGKWETWDALHGAWFSNSDLGSPDGNGLRTLAAYLAAAPNARLTSAMTIGAWGVGDSAPFVAEVDRVVVGVNGKATEYRFGARATAQHEDGSPPK